MRSRQPRFVGIVVAVVGMLFLFGFPPAAAEKSTLPADLKAALGQTRYVTWEGAGTSGCIGDAKTILCAIETIMACLSRGEKEICGPVGISTVYPIIGYSPTTRYVIYDVWEVPAGLDACPWTNQICLVDEPGQVAAYVDVIGDEGEVDLPSFILLLKEANGAWHHAALFMASP